MKTTIALLLLMAATASAAPLRLLNGTTVRVAVHGQRERGVGLAMKSHGWRLELSNGAAGVVEAVDVTDGAHDARWTMELHDRALFFDADRFIAGHAYRLVVRSGTQLRGTALIYLYPPIVAARSRVSFADDATGPDNGELAISKKPSL
jgi:hypothetical protein